MGTAGIFYAVPYFISVGLSPMFGYLVDTTGRKALFLIISALVCILAFAITLLVPMKPYIGAPPQYLMIIPLVLIGIGSSIFFGAFWSSIPYTVPPSVIGTAYGLFTALTNVYIIAGTLIGPIFLDSKPDKKDVYVSLNIYYILVSLLGLIFILWLYYDDIQNRDGILNNIDEDKGMEEATP